ncbi:hypothetical protein Trco_006146 [Trichoderma cornu-damae]|uniref:Velvet domain-containing protein n=1 Tax=Trichoderma cornu-damae TaxID=654480 RepID=A0A9P8QPU1_9HYPO|nr:hypothetical protein Trco_006146 [Trichoderma cornu-damae]
MAGVQVSSQPITHALTGQTLSPAITVQQMVQDSDAQYFATPVLLSNAGDVVEALQGTKAATGIPVNGASLPLAIKYSFTDLAISSPGTYYIRLDLYKMSTSGATLVSQVNLNTITVTN